MANGNSSGHTIYLSVFPFPYTNFCCSNNSLHWYNLHIMLTDVLYLPRVHQYASKCFINRSSDFGINSKFLINTLVVFKVSLNLDYTFDIIVENIFIKLYGYGAELPCTSSTTNIWTLPNTWADLGQETLN